MTNTVKNTDQISYITKRKDKSQNLCVYAEIIKFNVKVIFNFFISKYSQVVSVQLCVN